MAKNIDQKYPPVDASKLKTFPMEKRQHKVDFSAQAKLPAADATAADLLASLPDFLGAQQLRRLAETIAAAVKKQRPVFFAMGAHVIKVGCSPIIIDLMQRNILSGVIFNGAGGIHDFEMALTGQTLVQAGLSHCMHGRGM